MFVTDFIDTDGMLDILQYLEFIYHKRCKSRQLFLDIRGFALATTDWESEAELKDIYDRTLILLDRLMDVSITLSSSKNGSEVEAMTRIIGGYDPDIDNPIENKKIYVEITAFTEKIFERHSWRYNH